LLTVIIILKPGYSLTKKRNVQRLGGTLIGVAIGGTLLYFVKNNTAILVFLTICMIGGYSFMRWKYLVSVVMITMYLLFMFYILEPQDFREVAEARILDTAIGCVIAFIASYLLPPIWERQQIRDLAKQVIVDIVDYFESVAFVFTGKPYNKQLSREERKYAWVSLANLSDAFNRMLSEPRSQRKDSKEIHRLVVSSHMLVSHLATLTYYADSVKPEFIMSDYEPLITATIFDLKTAWHYLDSPYYESPKKNGESPQAQLDNKLNVLIQNRNRQLENGDLESEDKLYLSTFKSITDQFFFVYKTSQDLQNICSKLRML
jgi:uncharacterized membrane protein YccC